MFKTQAKSLSLSLAQQISLEAKPKFIKIKIRRRIFQFLILYETIISPPVAFSFRCKLWKSALQFQTEYHYLCGISPVETILNLNAYPESIMHNSEFISIWKIVLRR